MGLLRLTCQHFLVKKIIILVNACLRLQKQDFYNNTLNVRIKSICKFYELEWVRLIRVIFSTGRDGPGWVDLHSLFCPFLKNS